MRVIVLLLAVVAPVSAQSRPVLDSLVARIADGWVAAPCMVDCVMPSDGMPVARANRVFWLEPSLFQSDKPVSPSSVTK